MMNQSTLVFSIGPVQGFIAQSRRTADGWVGSYLLSYLAGTALAFLKEDRSAAIVEPDTTDVPMYEAIKRLRSSGTISSRSIGGDTTIAALPNVLVIQAADHKQGLDFGGEAQAQVIDAWKAIYGAVWSSLQSGIKGSPQFASGSNAEKVWGRQVGDHWEFNWACGATSLEAFQNLAARKGLRDFQQTEESGDRCTVCAQREALWDESTRRPWDAAAGKGHRQSRDIAKENWRGWAEQINSWKRSPSTLIHSDGKERLCAICLIKRLIPWVENPIKSILKAGDKSPDPSSVFPSTSTMATVRYRTELIEKACENDKLRKALDAYFKALKKPQKGYASRADSLDAFRCWESTKSEAVQHGWNDDDVKRLLRMDGDWYLYGDAVKNEEGISESEHKCIEKAYRALLAAARDAQVGETPIYHALLTMDGDKMGDFKEEILKAWGWPAAQEKLTEISGVLNRLARAVPGIISEKNGKTIYAGGDDVLALLPLDTALDAAEAVRKRFAELFTEWFEDQTKACSQQYEKIPKEHRTRTISGSIVYAHHQAPLGRVLHEGHRLLTDWAKKRADRKALAVQHYQRGGPSTTFAAKWDVDGQSLAKRLGSIQDKLKKGERQVASRFLYGLQNISWMFEEGGVFAGASNRDGAIYLKVLLLKSRLGESQSEEKREQEAQTLAQEIVTLCRCAKGEKGKGWAVEPLLIARFLAGGGREER